MTSAIDSPVDSVASAVVEFWTTKNNERHKWLDRVTDTRRYITSTSTVTTEVGSLPWKNKTTIPMLTQIADNLLAYYMAAVMPTDDWFRFEGYTIDDAAKALAIEEYMATKLKASGFRKELSKLVWDWIIYGNFFAGVEFVHEKAKSNITGEDITVYRGPRLRRISPVNCVIDLHARCFDESPFVHRRMVPAAEIIEFNNISDGPKYDKEAVEKVKAIRGATDDKDFVQQYIDNGLTIDGFDDFSAYLTSGYVEILEFWGDIYDPVTEILHKNQLITIADRMYVLRQTGNPSWSGRKPFVHVGWRILPDNLYAQGPLDNIVGMQYRIDHLENAKADAWDLIMHPIVKVVGDNVEDVEYMPGAVWRVNDGDIEFLRPDTTVLATDNQIAMYRALMEESAGSPREMAGFRTPGEKTAFEVNVLQQGADRKFQDKLNYLEDEGIQRILSIFFELLMRNFDAADVVKVFNDVTGAIEIKQIEKEDVVANGIFRPIGAKHFAARNKRIQELQNMLMIAQNPSIAPHFSGVNAGRMLEEELGWEKYNVIEENIGTREQVMTQATAQQMMQMLQQGGQLGPEEVPE